MIWTIHKCLQIQYQEPKYTTWFTWGFWLAELEKVAFRHHMEIHLFMHILFLFSGKCVITFCEMVWSMKEWRRTSLDASQKWEAPSVLVLSGQVQGLSPPHLLNPPFLYVFLLHSTKGLIFCMITPPPVLLLAPVPRPSQNTPSINTSEFLAESDRNKREKVKTKWM